MAGAIQSQGQLLEFLAILKRRAWQIVLPTAFGLSVGTFMATITPRTYLVQTQIQVREMTPPIGGRSFEATSIAREIANAQAMAKAPELVRRVVEKQEWEDYAGLSRDEQLEYLQRVLRSLKVIPVLSKNQQGSQFVTFNYSDSDPQRAARFLNDLRDVYVKELVDIGREKAREDRDKLQELRTEKERIYGETERKLAELRKKNKISPTQPAPGSGRQRAEDPLETIHGKARADYAQAKQQLEAEKARNAQLRKALEGEPTELAVVVTAAGVNTNQSIAQIEQQVVAQRQLQVGYLPAHSRYQKAQHEIDMLEKQKQSLLGLETSSTVQYSYQRNPKRDALEKQLADSDLALSTLEARTAALDDDLRELSLQVSELINAYREMATLDTDLTHALAAFSDADLRYQQQKQFYEYISGPPGNPFEVIERAEPPKTPTSPIVPLVIITYGVIGLALGLASSLLAEFGRNAYRSVGDVARSMSTPVLGAVGSIVTRHDQRTRAVRRALIGVASAVLIGSVLWVTWAWVNHQRYLGTEVRAMINDLREQLR